MYYEPRMLFITQLQGNITTYKKKHPTPLLQAPSTNQQSHWQPPTPRMRYMQRKPQVAWKQHHSIIYIIYYTPES